MRADRRLERELRAAAAKRRKVYERIRAAADPTTAYARAVVGKQLLAGPHVRNACRRHLRDLKDGAARGLVWDLAAARRFINFCPDVCRLNGGQWAGRPFLLNGWQAFVGGCLFGWKRRDDGDKGKPASQLFRRFTTAFIETGKGSGKSPLAAAIGLYGLTADNEQGAEIYAAATKKDQAMVLFRDAVSMVDMSPDLTHALKKSGVGLETWNLAYPVARSFFRPISSEKKGQSGPRPHISLLDEIHEHDDNVMVEMLKSGHKFRRQPLMVMITNSGVDKTSVCFEYHQHAAKVAAGAIEDDSFFGYVCALDKGENPLKSEACWPKANPSLEESDLPGMKYLRDQVSGARGMASKASIVRRLNFCEWVAADNPAIARDVWEAIQTREFDLERLRGRRCYMGMDLASTTDLTAVAFLFEPADADPAWTLMVRFWVPGDSLTEREERDKVPYIAWRDAGHIYAPAGTAVDRLAVAMECAKAAAAWTVDGAAYDRWRFEDFKKELEDAGVEIALTPHGQGMKDMAPSVEAFEFLLLCGAARAKGGAVPPPPPTVVVPDGQLAERLLSRFNAPLRVIENPCLSWNAANAVFETDAAGNRKPTKKKATGRIDGIVAAIMAVGLASRGAQNAGGYSGVMTV